MWATKETPQKSSHSYNTTTLLAKHITSQAVSNSQLQLPNLEASWGFAAAKDAPQRRVTMPEGAQPEVGIEPVGLMMVDAKLIKSDPSDRLVSRCLIFFAFFIWFLGWMPAKFRLKEPALWDGQCDVGCFFLGGAASLLSESVESLAFYDGLIHHVSSFSCGFIEGKNPV